MLSLVAAHRNEIEETDEIKAFNVKIGRARAMLEVNGQVAEKVHTSLCRLHFHSHPQ